MRLIFLILTILFTGPLVYAGEMIVVDTKKDSPKYEWITSVRTGPVVYDRDDPKCRYRAVVTTFEKYDAIYIEKLKIKGEKAIPDRVEWTRRIRLAKIMNKLNITNKQRNIKLKKWMNSKSLSLEFGGYSLTILDVGLKSVTVVIVNS